MRQARRRLRAAGRACPGRNRAPRSVCAPLPRRPADDARFLDCRPPSRPDRPGRRDHRRKLRHRLRGRARADAPRRARRDGVPQRGQGGRRARTPRTRRSGRLGRGARARPRLARLRPGVRRRLRRGPARRARQQRGRDGTAEAAHRGRFRDAVRHERARALRARGPDAAAPARHGAQPDRLAVVARAPLRHDPLRQPQRRGGLLAVGRVRAEQARRPDARLRDGPPPPRRPRRLRRARRAPRLHRDEPASGRGGHERLGRRGGGQPRAQPRRRDADVEGRAADARRRGRRGRPRRRLPRADRLGRGLGPPGPCQGLGARARRAGRWAARRGVRDAHGRRPAPARASR